MAKTSREEKIRARDSKLKESAYDAKMEQLYRQVVLKEPEPPKSGFVSLDALTAPKGNGLHAIAPAPAKAETESDLVGTQGD
ncbi:MAG: hypothetical protein U5J83_15580 [Bryobacterales bacterium]|nr:hypothetical protein [Bryobacterales bacterium]